MLLRHLYRISLEDRSRWPMWFGLPPLESSFETFQVASVESYMAGMVGATHDISPRLDDLSAFFVWLRDERNEFPTQGWCASYLERCCGDNFDAVAMLFEFMFEYIVKEMPAWFLEINREPLLSQIEDAEGTPHRKDIRNATHIAICQAHSST